MTLKRFRIPCENIQSTFSDARLQSPVIVVAIIGKTAPDNIPKLELPAVMDDINELIRTLGAQRVQSDDMTQFESYFDPDENVVYLSLIGPSDNATQKLSSLGCIKTQIEQQGFLNYWTNGQNAYARALLFILSISHIVLFATPSYSLNVKTIQFFKVLSCVRAKYQTTVSRVLGKHREISEDWAFHGRLCSPRLIFLFKGCPYEIIKETNKYDRISKIKKLEHSLEDQIYILLRKSKVVKDACNRALFSIAPNDEFVFVGLNAEMKPVNQRLENYFKLIVSKSGGTLSSNSVPTNDAKELTVESLASHELISNPLGIFFPNSMSMNRAEGSTTVSETSEKSKSGTLFSNSLTSDDSGGSADNPLASQDSKSDSLNSFFPTAMPVSDERLTIDTEASQESNSDSVSSFYSSAVSINGGLVMDSETSLESKSDSTNFFSAESMNTDSDTSQKSKNSDIPSDLSSSDSDSLDSEEEIFETRESTQMPRHSLKELVMRHVRKAHSDGFSDNMGKFSHVRPFFEVPTLKTWLIAVNAVLNNIESGLKEPNSISIYLEKFLGTELKFSNARCKKVLPLALAIYQENLPSHYNQITHEKQIKHAVAVFSHHARGPAQQRFIEDLKDECNRIWRNGRQTCEALSLNKNSCTKPKHLSSVHQLGESDHWSGVQFYSSCNCGAKQGPRQDPFTLRAANHDFYQIIGQECGCIHSDIIQFPVFQPSTSDFREADLSNPSHITDSIISNIQDVQNELHEMNLVSPSLSTGKVWNVHESALGSEAAMSIPLSTSIFDKANNLAINYYSHSHNEKHLVRQASTTEYLPGMIHLESPAGLLPQFPSWSLLCRGPSSLYSHNLGLHDCPGFIPGSSYLLPWDVSFRERDMSKRESNDVFIKSGLNSSVQILRPGNRRNQRATKEFMSVKIFIGVEYECVRGHRFMSSGPGTVLKATASGVKEDAHKITEGNMPLFVPCPCGKVFAQLMRVHIVTPKAPVFVTIDPKVRPAPPPCPTFLPGEPKPIALSQSAYWVLRLPYVYASERKVYSIPTRMKTLKYGELLGPMYGITQADV